MPEILLNRLALIVESLLNPPAAKPLSHGFHLLGETNGQSDSQLPQLTGNWQKQDNTEHSDTEDEVKLHEFMEDIKRYIRSIDVSNL
jgi:hypothetical protein